MSKLSLNEAKKETKRQALKMPNENWSIHTRFVELVEEVGELANAIQTDEGFKSKKRKKSDITNCLCDILYEIFLISDHYQVDLDKEYPLVLEEIEGRRKAGDFEDKK
jgi:NTP pyrophosphatase (non-canonical NTP hydrolase)